MNLKNIDSLTLYYKNYISKPIILHTIYLKVATYFNIRNLRIVASKESINICIHTHILVYVYVLSLF